MVRFKAFWDENMKALFVPNDETHRLSKVPEAQCLCGFADFVKARKLHLYIKSTSNGARICAEVEKSHNLRSKQRQHRNEAVAVFEITEHTHVRVFI